MEHKDYFSGHSHLYATFRPVYPQAIYEFIYRHLNGRDSAWDCATGNGQVARELAKHFNQVWATDISTQQLEHAHQGVNIHYSVSSAEKTTFPDHQFDLITVAQALHWFKFDDFYKEVNRTSKSNALLAVWSYALCKVDTRVDELYLHFYHDVVGPYWDSVRKFVENEYRDIPFPYKRIDTPKFFIEVNWSLVDFLGYVSTWSATQKFIKEKRYDPINNLSYDIEKCWSRSEKKKVTFPITSFLGWVR
ncbi:MAG TPA: class I SAM-dependent methyltransferase [Cyclobacteriaceae bacterium]|nr:class I SAM-dependent methyltransferase [Cyclobacteriaceae bacterium]